MKKILLVLAFVGCSSPPIEVPPPVEITFAQSVKIVPYVEGYLDGDTAHLWIYGHAVNVTEKRLEPIYPVGYIFTSLDSLYANKPQFSARGSFGVLTDPPEPIELKSRQSHLDPNGRVHFLIVVRFLYTTRVYWDVGVTIDDKPGLSKRELREIRLEKLK